MSNDSTKASAARVYTEVKELVHDSGGTMTWEPLVPGGVWVITLHGLTLRVRVRDDRVNDLDKLYKTDVRYPQTWGDYPEGEATSLKDDAFWRLVAIVRAGCD